MPYFYLGQLVQIALSQEDINAIESKRLLYASTSDAEYHQGSELSLHRNVAAIITRVDTTATYGVRVLLDGTDDHWIPVVPSSNMISAEPPQALPSPESEVDRLWPALRMKIKQLLQSSTSVITNIIVN